MSFFLKRKQRLTNSEYHRYESLSEEQELGELVIVLGDFHIPQRCAEVPPHYKSIILPNKAQAVICTGNFGSREAMDWVKTLAPKVYIVHGDYEDPNLGQFPQQKVIEDFERVKIGLIHGHQMLPWGDDEALQVKARQMGVKMLISGHTHTQRVSVSNGVYLLNPGSITGAYSSFKEQNEPCFMLLQMKSNQVVIYSYKQSEENPDSTVILKSDL